MRPGFIGIDAAFAKNKRLPVSICTWRGERLVPEPLRRLSFEPPRGSGNAATLDSKKVDQFAREATAYIFAVCPELRIQPHRIAIDAPSAPRRQGIPRRTAEVAMNASGISCFGTPSASEFDSIRTKVSAHLASGGAESHMPHANQLWMLVGFSLLSTSAKSPLASRSSPRPRQGRWRRGRSTSQTHAVSRLRHRAQGLRRSSLRQPTSAATTSPPGGRHLGEVRESLASGPDPRLDKLDSLKTAPVRVLSLKQTPISQQSHLGSRDSAQHTCSTPVAFALDLHADGERDHPRERCNSALYKSCSAGYE